MQCKTGDVSSSLLPQLAIKVEVFEIPAGAVHAHQAKLVGLAHAQAKGGQPFLTGWLGSELGKQVVGRFLQRSRGFALGVAHDPAVGRVGRVARDARHLQRLAIGPGTVAVESAQEYRTIGDHFVEEFLVRQSRGAEGRVGPAHALNPLLFGMSVGVRFHPLLNLSHRLRSVEIHLGETERTFHEVDVTVNETGKDQLALSVDHFRGRSAICGDLFRAPYGEDFFAADGKRFRPGLSGVDGVDPRVHDDRVRRCWRPRPGAGPGSEHGKKD